jgi:hypothetical protein
MVIDVEDSENLKTIDDLALKQERTVLEQVMRDSKCAVRVLRAVCNLKNMQAALSFPSRVLHFSGHGSQKNGLVIEDDQEAKGYPISKDNLRSYLSIAFRQRPFRLVVVSACHSEVAAQAFIECGIPSVIAIKLADKIKDKTAQLFLEHFYTALFNHKSQGRRTIRESYELALQNIKIVMNVLGDSEAAHFTLLPADGDHNVYVFDENEIPEGSYSWRDHGDPGPGDCREHKDVAKLPPPEIDDHFRGRKIEMYHIIRNLNSRARLLLVTGAKGIGKSAVIKATLSYLAERRRYDNYVIVDGQQALKSERRPTLLELTLRTMRLSETLKEDALVKILK